MAAADATKPEPDDAANADFWKHIANKARESSIFSKTDDWHDCIPDEDDFEPAWQAREHAIGVQVSDDQPGAIRLAGVLRHDRDHLGALCVHGHRVLVFRLHCF